MSGVTIGSRLEQLRALRNRTAHEVDQAAVNADPRLGDLGRLLTRLDEAIAAETVPDVVHTTSSTTREPYVDRVQLLLSELSVTTADVRAWALETGLVTEVKRGRISGALVEAYAAAHPTSDLTTTTEESNR